MPGNKLKSITKSRRKAYESIKSSGVPKSVAAAIANKGKTATGRKSMARKAARTRAKRRGR